MPRTFRFSSDLKDQNRVLIVEPKNMEVHHQAPLHFTNKARLHNAPFPSFGIFLPLLCTVQYPAISDATFVKKIKVFMIS
jgi:hypothetical protein